MASSYAETYKELTRVVDSSVTDNLNVARESLTKALECESNAENRIEIKRVLDSVLQLAKNFEASADPQLPDVAQATVGTAGAVVETVSVSDADVSIGSDGFAAGGIPTSIATPRPSGDRLLPDVPAATGPQLSGISKSGEAEVEAMVSFVSR